MSQGVFALSGSNERRKILICKETVFLNGNLDEADELNSALLQFLLSNDLPFHSYASTTCTLQSVFALFFTALDVVTFKVG